MEIDKSAILNFEDSGFPKSFYFFGYVLSHKASLETIPKIILIYNYIQQIVLCFLPLMCNYQYVQTNTGFFRFICAILLFKVNLPTYESNEPIIASIAISLTLIIASTLFFYFCYLRGLQIPTVIYRCRGLLFLYVPTILLITTTVHLGFSISVFGYDINYQLEHLIANIVIAITIIIAIIAFSVWVNPIIVKTPIHSKSHLPSRLIPDYFSFIDTVVLAVIALVQITAQSDTSSYFYVAGLAIYGIWRCFLLWRVPLLSRSITAVYMAISVCFVIESILVQVFISNKFFNETIISLVCVGILIIAFLISYFSLSHREKRISQRLLDGCLKFTDVYDALRVTQLAVLKNSINRDLLSALNEINRIQGTPAVLAAEVYARILIGDESDYSVIEQMITPLVYDQSSSWSHRFTIFELTKQFLRENPSKLAINNISDIARLIQAYDTTYDRFWTETLTGDINTAIVQMVAGEKLYAQIWYQYQIISTFFPQNEEILSIKQNFFKRTGDNSLQQESVDDLAVRHSSFIGLQRTTGRKKFVLENEEETNEQRINTSISRGLKKGLPLWTIVTLTFLCLLFIGFEVLLLLPSIHATGSCPTLTEIPQFVTLTQNVIGTWLNISVAATHIFNNTAFSTSSCQEEVIGSDIYHCTTIADLMNNLTDSAWFIVQSINRLSTLFDQYNSEEELSAALGNWLDQSIVTFEENTTLSLAVELKQNIQSVLINFAGLIILRGNLTDPEARVLWPDADQFSNMTTTIFKLLLNTYDHYDKHVKVVEESSLTLTDPIIISVTVVVIVVFLVCVFLLADCTGHEYYKLIQNHFCTHEHPNPEIEEIYDDEIIYRPYKAPFEVWFLFFAGIFTVVIAIAINVGLNYTINDYFSDGLKELKSMKTSAVLSAKQSLITQQVQDSWEFSNDTYLRSNLSTDVREIISIGSDIQAQLSPYELKQFKKNGLPSALLSKDIYDNDTITVHLIHEKIGLHRISNLFSFIAYRISQNGLIFNDSSIDSTMVTLQHIMLGHIEYKHVILGDELTAHITDTARIVKFLGFIQICVNLFVIAMIIIWVLFIFLELRALKAQFNRIITYLSPQFIARHQCLMTLFLRTSADYTGINSELFSLLSEANLNIIVTASDNSIICATRGIQNVFGHTPQQLVGQNIDILIQPGGRNDVKFFRPIRMMHKRQAEPSLERDLIGTSIDGTQIPVHVAATMFVSDNRDFFLLEVKALDEATYIEDNYVKCNEVATDLINMSLPLSLFESRDFDRYTERHFDRGVLALIGFVEDKSISPNQSLDIRTGFVADMVPLLSGYGNAIVVQITCSYALILFVDADNDGSHMTNTLELFRAFTSEEDFSRCGFAIECEDFDVVIFREPQVPPGYEGKQIPLEEARKYVATMSIEPKIDEMRKLPELVQLLKEGLLLVSPGFAQIIDISEKKCITGSSLSLFAVDIDSI